MLLQSSWRYLRAEISHGESDYALDDLGKMADQIPTCFAKDGTHIPS